MFKLWSETNPEAKKLLSPDLGMREWDDLTCDEKNNIWCYLRVHFFNTNGNKFYGEHPVDKYRRHSVEGSILLLNEESKTNSFAKHYLGNPSLDTACHDFFLIFMNNKRDVVMELLSFYARTLFNVTKDKEYVYKKEGETEEQFTRRKTDSQYIFFDDFAERLNEVFLQFGIKWFLTRDGFVPRQEQRILEEVYVPVIGLLSHPKWEVVNKILTDAFSEYRKNTPLGYSSCVAQAVSAAQAFLQILVYGKIGKGDTVKVLAEAQRRGLVPDDQFSKRIFGDLESVFAKERQETSRVHPAEEYANEKKARLVLNLVMVFFQHCIQK